MEAPTPPGERAFDLRNGLCGWTGVTTDTDITKVTCKPCLAITRGTKKPPKAARARATKTEPDDLARLLAPKAPAPPTLDPATWAACCDATRSCGASHSSGPRQCGTCARCLWEREANLWGSPEVAAHNKQERVAKLPNAPRWPNVNRALVAYAEYHAHARCAKSATGGILARIEFGSDTGGGATRPDDPLQRAADDIVAVEQALGVAFPEGGHLLAQRVRIEVLLLRTPGVAPVKVDKGGTQIAPVLPTYEELADCLSVSVGSLQALVNTGRDRVAENLFERGMIPRQREQRRDARGGQRAQVMEQQQEAST